MRLVSNIVKQLKTNKTNPIQSLFVGFVIDKGIVYICPAFFGGTQTTCLQTTYSCSLGLTACAHTLDKVIFLWALQASFLNINPQAYTHPSVLKA